MWMWRWVRVFFFFKIEVPDNTAREGWNWGLISLPGVGRPGERAELPGGFGPRTGGKSGGGSQMGHTGVNHTSQIHCLFCQAHGVDWLCF